MISMLLIVAFFVIICLVCIHYMVDKKTKRSIIAMMLVFAATMIIDTAVAGLTQLLQEWDSSWKIDTAVGGLTQLLEY